VNSNPNQLRPKPDILFFFFTFLAASIVLSGCGPSPELQSTLTSTSETATAAAWTDTSTPTLTFTPTLTYTSTSSATSTSTPSSTYSPTATYTPSITPTATMTTTPTFDYPKVTVNKAAAACKFGPSKAYLWANDLKGGDTGVVWGRAPYGSNWLYVKWDRWPNACWVSPSVVDVIGNINRVIVERVRLPFAMVHLYDPPNNVKAERQGDQVIVTWTLEWMTEDDDRGYFLDVWVCQNGNYIWNPVGLPDQFTTTVTYTDQPGCSQPSGGQIYTVEKHGYTSPAQIPWPPYIVSQPNTETPTEIPPIVESPTETPALPAGQ
jgi:hypothetical protein